MEQNLDKGYDEEFCSSCGQVVKKEAIICVHCGVPLKGSKGQKDKTVAILLAVFLAFWTWVYTYKKDAWKFWLNLVLSIVTLGFWSIVAWIWAIIDVSVKPQEFYNNYPNG